MIRKPERQVRKASHCGSKQQQRWHAMITLLLLVHAMYIWVLFFAHIPFMMSRTFNTMPTERLQQHPLLLTTNHSDRTFFLWRLHLVRPSHPGHSTILLWSESPSSKCAKLHIVAASNNRDNIPWSLYYCMFTPHIYGCYSSCTSCSWWITHSMQRQLRGCNMSNWNCLLIQKLYHYLNQGHTLNDINEGRTFKSYSDLSQRNLV